MKTLVWSDLGLFLDNQSLFIDWTEGDACHVYHPHNPHHRGIGENLLDACNDYVKNVGEG